jgi:NodT family efflux transporter outer membrane factor (OMF) lipoprotein
MKEAAMKNYLMNPFEGRLHWPSISFDRLPRPGAAALTTLVALASAVVLLAGCASPGTPLRKLDETPAAAVGLSVAPATAAPARWWATLGDAQLATLVDKALRDQPSLAAAQARVQQALALAQVTEAADGPQADLSASATRQRYPEHGLYPAPIAGSILNSGSVNAGFGWSPDWYGRQAAALASSLDQARAAQADAALAANALATQVARSYVGLARLAGQREVAVRTLEQRQEMKELTRQRVAAGLDTRVEEVQADSALPDTRNQIEALDEQITLARHQLASLTAQAPDALDALAPSLAQINVQRLPATLGADLLGRRPEVVAARWRVEAASQDIKVARTAFYPDINLTAFVGLSAIGLDQLFEAGSHQYGVTPALHLPLFDGGRLRAQLHGRQAELNAAIAQYNANVLDAVREASDAIGSLQSLERQRREQADALAGAQTAHELALQRYRAGLGSYLIVLNTESQWLAQRRAAVDLQARQLDTGIALIKSLGGGWQGDPPAPAKVAAAH